ncbi:bifunctional 4-hydroxy-2-oxoglutarate aldolase/2-dehydro-3-deoxy-phosphogluconate aldolase [Anaerotruncus rubiinfantis]|uniref:bifunctional 4-hydroxy-2-oxoglutarate aldolase/2-dehydro-3-deoxy-phosphogluconate aldolase n=1 Tax=Anaerotruncus rubiinfantis TaxID=1720200 RepID=UPI0034A5646F
MIIATLNKFGILPIINSDDPSCACELCRSLSRAGMMICEVVFRSSKAPELLSEMRSACPDMLIGAGTITCSEQADLALRCGAQFLVSPGLDPELVKYCQQKNVLPIPGATSATEVQIADKLGLAAVKFFPAKQMGGLATINALAAPFPQMKYIPTNGVGFDNVAEYSANSHILACGGTFPTPPDMIRSKDWDGISRLCEKSLELARRGREKLEEQNEVL